MAWSATALGFVGNTAAASTYSTFSYTPTANRFLVAAVQNSGPGADDTANDHPSFSGNGVTWSQVAQAIPASSSRVLTLFVALSGASPTTDAATASYGQNQAGCAISVFEMEINGGMPATALAAVVQSATDAPASGATSASITLASAPAVTSRCIATFSINRNDALDPRTNWTEIHDIGFATPDTHVQTQWRSDAAEQTGSASGWISSLWRGIVVEIAETATGDQTVSPGLITNTPVVYGPRIDQQVQIGLIANGYAIFAPTIAEEAAGPQTVSPGLIENTPVLYAPRVDQSVLIGLIQNTPTLFAPTISQTVDIGLINNAPTVYEPRIDQQVLIGLIENLVNIYAPTVNQQVRVGLIANPSTVYAPTITDDGPQTVSVGLISHGTHVYSPTITQFWVRESGTRPRRGGVRMARKQNRRFDRGRDTGR